MNYINKIYLAYKNKVTNKLFGVVNVCHTRKKVGNALVSFITGPFIQAPWEFFTDPHPNYWTCAEIVRLLNARGYNVDIIDWDNETFIPKKKYDICIDIHHNLERLLPYLGPSCIKAMFIVASYPLFQNNAEKARLNNFEKRKGIKLPQKRYDPLSNNLKYIDFIAGYGNKTVHGTYPLEHKSIIPIPIPAVETYNFQEDKDFETARKHFLWFGGGGAILKGLDIVIETFAKLPHLKLSIIGPSAFEKDFEKIYAKELELPNIVRYSKPKIQTDGSITTDGIPIQNILNSCAAIVSLSGSEGGGGATIQAMQAGLFPIITPQTGINEDAPSIVITEPTIENITKTVQDFSLLPPEELKSMAKDAWQFVRNNHTKKHFTESFDALLENILNTK
jgi:hypothetical protein